MQNEEKNLNTEDNDIAGNRLTGPVNNTAAKPGPVVGQPGGVGHTSSSPSGEQSTVVPPSSEALASAEMSVGQGGVGSPLKPQENKEANPADLHVGGDGASRPGSEPGSLNNPIAEIPHTSHQTEGGPEHQPDAYGGNFSNSTQSADHDRARYDNQASDPNRGEFGVQGNLGTTHGGFGNQFREGITEHQGMAEKLYYGDGNVRLGSGDHNTYRDYDGRDERPDVLPTPAERAVNDLPPVNIAVSHPTTSASQPLPSSSPGNPADNRNQPYRSDPAAAFQNDNGSTKAQGSTYAADYGHTSGVGLAGAEKETQAPPTAAGRNQAEDQQSSRGGYDNQDNAVRPQTSGAPAPAGPAAPQAPQGEGYGHGYQRSEQPHQSDPATGSDREGATSGTQLASHGGDTGKGYGSKGGSYDDQNPGAHPNGLDQHTKQAQTNQEGSENRAEHRPADADKESYGPTPQRNEGREE